MDASVGLEPPLILPPYPPERGRDGWMRMGEALMAHVRGAPLPPSVSHWARMTDTFRAGDAAGFNAAVDGYKRSFGPDLAGDVRKGRWEFFFNQMAPFYDALVIYVAAFLLALFFWFHFAEWARKTAFALIGLAFVIHTAGLLFRMVLEGRPPVTNLYSSAIFIGWGAVVLGMLLEKFWKNAIGLVVASALGFVTLIIAHNLALGGDTMVMLEAVLDTNFWLATHVVIVTLGYASTYVAGFLAIVYILRGVLTRGLDEATGRSLARMVYGIICFATLFSFIGTVLGGIWADQSWGRFWGWDPKENGALIIVLWNALLLHARWGGLVRERGLMALTVVGNIVTSWSWFGTNMLGIGLHSYGFMSGAFLWLGIFILSQLVIMTLGLLPPQFWRSHRTSHASAPSPGPGPRPLPAGAAAR
ncbi:MAG: cytochrome c biogenesis protein CcsA [Verrucomicrobiae bacterium]|nr:cytochrome c biogenesis protein CcsA [Verrucomicrobiae bacterium]